MTLEDRLQQCRICLNRKINPAIGLVCGLTMEKPAFEGNCPDIKVDQAEADRLIQLEREARAEENDSSGYFGPEKKGIKMGVPGGILMIVIAVIWFFGGLAAGYVFFYPPILLCIGIYALVRGMFKQSD